MAYDEDDEDGKLGWLSRRSVEKHRAEEEAKLKELEERLGDAYPENEESPSDDANKSDDADALKDQEGNVDAEKLDALHGHLGLRYNKGKESAGADMKDRLNKGYTGSGGKKTRMSKMYNSDSKFKKKVAIAGAAAGGSAGLSLLLFVLLLPLKVEAITQSLNDKFSATATSAVDEETEHLFSDYVKNDILPSIHIGACHSTLDAKCVVTTNGTSPVAKLYAAWSKGRLENKLATKYGIVISGSGTNYYMSIHGTNVGNQEQFRRLRTDPNFSIFDLQGTKQVTRTEIRAAVKESLKDATLYDKVYFRFKVGKMIETQYGIKRCILACKTKDRITDAIADQQLAAKAYLIQRVLSPTSESYGLILQCVLASADGCDPSVLQNAAPGDTRRVSNTQRKIQEQLVAYEAKYGADSLKDLVKTAQDISKNGLQEYVVRQSISKVVGALGGDAAAADAAGETAEKAVGPVGWAIFFAGVLSGAGRIGPLIQYDGFTSSKSTAVALASTYNTVAAETTSGNAPPAEAGSFDTALSTNISGYGPAQDFTDSPLFNAYFTPTTPATTGASILSDLFFPGSASAAVEPSKQVICDNHEPIPSGELKCPEERFDQGNKYATELSDSVNSVPLIVPIASTISTVGNAPSNALGSALEAIPGYSSFTSWATSPLTGPVSLVEKKMIVTPFNNNMTGPRQIDMMMAGDQAIGSDATAQLGGIKASNATVNAIEGNQTLEAKADFDSQSMFARMFSTSSPYSLISRMAMDMPTDFLTATHSGLASILTNPLDSMLNAFSSVFATNHAFAATEVPEQFGLTQNYFPSSAIPANSDAYWTQNCVNGPMAIYDPATQHLDVSNWLNAEQMDKNNGEAYSNTPNPCLLIQASVEATGGLLDNSLIPPDEENSDPAV